MKTLEFKYIKPNGEVSDRALVAFVTPSTMYEGIDVSELTTDEFGEFLEDFRALKDRQTVEFNELMRAYDLASNYRRFKPENMSEVNLHY